MKIIGYTLSGGKLSNDVSQNHKPSKFGVRVEGEGGLSVILGGLDHCCLVVERADPGIKSESSLVDLSSSVTVKKRRENILPAIKVFTFEKLDVNLFRGQRVNLQVDLMAKK